MKFVYTAIAMQAVAMAANAQDTTLQRADLHFQTTYIYQYKPEFRASYSGAHSISSKEEKQNSLTATLYFGLRLWKGAELYINPEVAGGSGLTGAFGMAGSTNGETFRVGDPAPSLYLARAFFKQTIALSDKYSWLDDGQNQLHTAEPERFIRLVVGKFSLGDCFDNNRFANGPRTQFLNWALMNNSAWDYSANLRGYTAGAIVALKWDKMCYKLAMAAEPTVANGGKLNYNYGMSQGIVAEAAREITINKREGNIRLLVYRNQANMGSYREAINNTNFSGGQPDVITSEHNGNTKTGFGINVDQSLTDYLGVFARIGWNDGFNETWAFTEADETASAGVNVDGWLWHRKNDNVGVGFVANGLSKDHRDYLAAGGLGFQLGDGALAYAPEMVGEVYYSCHPVKQGIWLSGDYQFAAHPGYNKDRGPLSVFSFRLHVEI
jgi:high affinity Mn2+ porin